MKNIFKKLTISLLYFVLSFILLVNFAMANSIHLSHEDGNIEILQWDERDFIENLDLFSDITLQLKITKNLDTTKKLSFTFDAGEFVSSNKKIKPAQNFKATLCKERQCDKILNSAIKFQPIGPGKFKEYQINISQKELRWDNFRNEDVFYLKITYNIPNYIQSEDIFSLIPIDPDKTVIIGTGCTGSNFCPKPNMVYKDFILPEKIILKGYTQNGKTLHSSKVLGLFWNDFTTSKGKNDYQTILIQYTDIKAERKLFLSGLFLSAIAGALIGGLISLRINRHYYNKSKKDNESELFNLKQKFRDKLSTNNFNKKYKFLNDNLDKLKNLIKRKYKRR